MGVILPTVIITADDFGFSPSVNEAIVRSLRDGLVTHASLLVNLEGFESACEAVRSNGLQDRIGLHFNLTEGRPVTKEMQNCAKFCIDGRFAPLQHFSRYSTLAPEERHAVEREAYAQVAAA